VRFKFPVFYVSIQRTEIVFPNVCKNVQPVIIRIIRASLQKTKQYNEWKQIGGLLVEHLRSDGFCFHTKIFDHQNNECYFVSSFEFRVTSFEFRVSVGNVRVSS
jgi:hypothetical protein